MVRHPYGWNAVTFTSKWPSDFGKSKISSSQNLGSRGTMKKND